MFHIELQKISKDFNTSGKIISNLDLKIERGEFVTLLGPSGSGKSTLLRLIAGLDKVNSGTLIIRQDKKFDQGFVFQESSLMPWRSVTENVALPFELAKSPINYSRIQSVLQLVGLEDAANLFPHELSGGMKMRTSLARALLLEPSLLLLDEPFASLDEGLRFTLSQELRKIWLKTKMSVVLVTHSLSEATFMSNRALILSKKPANFVADIKIDLPTERNLNLRTDILYLQALENITNQYRNHHNVVL